MIRPATFLCASLFVFSGFHLYQTKHRAQEVDRSIVRTMREVAKAHDHAVLLRAEYALLNDPTRLQELAQQYLALRPTAPGQFVAMADLASRLPPVGPSPNEAPAAPPPAEPLIASATPAPAPAQAPAPAAVAEAPPQRPAPAHVAAPRPAPVVVAANPPMQALVRAVAPARPPHREAPSQLAPTPLHPAAPHARSPAYVAPAYAARQPAVVARQQQPYAPPAPVRARYEPPTYSGTPFEAPRYANSPARPMGGSMLGMAYTGYQSGGGR
jgi:hypothetical protein